MNLMIINNYNKQIKMLLVDVDKIIKNIVNNKK